MNCSHFLSELDKLDNEEMSENMLAHLHKCPSCQRQAEKLFHAMELCKMPDLSSGIDISMRVSSLISFVPSPRRQVSMFNWIGVGAFIMLSLIIVPFLTNFQILSEVVGLSYTLTAMIVLGLVFSLYIAFFVLSHMDDMEKLAKEKNLA